VKELDISATEEDCGVGMYYGDYWNAITAECEFRKCAPEGQCQHGARIQYYDEITSDGKSEYTMKTREQYCCDTDMCNSAVGRGLSWLLTAGATLAVALALSWELAR